MSYFTQTGQWIGYFEFQKQKTTMIFNNFYINPVPQGYLKGGGSDQISQFYLKGSFNDNATAVRFIKQYTGKEKYHIIYQGQFDGNQIQGWWGYQPGKKVDKFKIWMQ